MITGKINATDLDIAARTICGEARGEDWEGKKAVGHVILNRWKAESWYGDSIGGVCLKPWQFSCWNENDPNRAKIERLVYGKAILRECISAMIAVLDEHDEDYDPTLGSMHYHTQDLFPPPWAQGKSPVIVIGAHVFYNDID